MQRFGGPAQRNARGHCVQTELFYNVDEREDFVSRFDAKKAAERKDELVVVADADGLVFMTFFIKFAPELSDMDAADRAAYAGHLAHQIVLGKRFAADLISVLKHRLLEILGWQYAEGIERLDVDGRSQVVILLHQLGFRAFLVDGAIRVPVGGKVLDRNRRRAVNLHRLQIFCAHRGAEAETAKVAVGIHADAGVGNAVFTRGADADDAALSGAGLPLANDAANHCAGQSPERAGVAKRDVVRADGDVHRSLGFAGDNDCVVSRLHHGKREPSARVTFA